MVIITNYVFWFYTPRITNYFLLVYVISPQYSTSSLCTSRRRCTNATYARVIGWASVHTWYDTTRKNTQINLYPRMRSVMIPLVKIYHRTMLRPWRSRQESKSNQRERRRRARYFPSYTGAIEHQQGWDPMKMSENARTLCWNYDLRMMRKKTNINLGATSLSCCEKNWLWPSFHSNSTHSKSVTIESCSK